jgi:hypothetical protein
MAAGSLNARDIEIRPNSYLIDYVNAWCNGALNIAMSSNLWTSSIRMISATASVHAKRIRWELTRASGGLSINRAPLHNPVSSDKVREANRVDAMNART